MANESQHVEKIRDPGTLPTELFAKILDYVRWNPDDKTARLQPPDHNILGLRSCTLVSHTWHPAAAQQLYNIFVFDSFNDYCGQEMQPFLRTILSKPARAALVNTLTVTDWPFGEAITSMGMIDMVESMPTSEEQLHQAALDSADLFGQQQFTFKEGDPSPWMALLMTHLPNLATLKMDYSEDPFFNVVLRNAIRMDSKPEKCFFQIFKESRFDIAERTQRSAFADRLANLQSTKSFLSPNRQAVWRERDMSPSPIISENP